MADQKDVLIIGGGPIGLACGLACEEHNLSYTIIEKGVLVNSIYHYPRNMRFFSTSDKLEIGGIPFISAQPKPDRDEALAYYGRIGHTLKSNLALYEQVTAPRSSVFSSLAKKIQAPWLSCGDGVASVFLAMPSATLLVFSRVIPSAMW